MPPFLPQRRQSSAADDWFQVTNANETVEKFMGGKQKPWMNAGKALGLPTHWPPVRQRPQPQKTVSSAPSDTNVLPSPAPSDEPSPAVVNVQDSPNPRNDSLLSLQRQDPAPAVPIETGSEAFREEYFVPQAAPHSPKDQTRKRSLATALNVEDSPSSVAVAGSSTAPPATVEQQPPQSGGSQLIVDEDHPSKRRRIEILAIPLIYKHIEANGGEKSLSAEAKCRFQLLTDACVRNDHFYLTVHQLFCLWSIDPPTVSKLLSCSTAKLAHSFEVLGDVLRANVIFSRANLEWCANFPLRASQLHETKYRPLLDGPGRFLVNLSQHWPSLIQATANRQYPFLVDELLGQLLCFSPLLQQIFFRCARRRLGVTDQVRDGQEAKQIDDLFEKDLVAHMREDVFLPIRRWDSVEELEGRNTRLIQVYRQAVVQAKQASLQQAGTVAQMPRYHIPLRQNSAPSPNHPRSPNLAGPSTPSQPQPTQGNSFLAQPAMSRNPFPVNSPSQPHISTSAAPSPLMGMTQSPPTAQGTFMAQDRSSGVPQNLVLQSSPTSDQQMAMSPQQLQTMSNNAPANMQNWPQVQQNVQPLAYPSQMAQQRFTASRLAPRPQAQQAQLQQAQAQLARLQAQDAQQQAQRVQMQQQMQMQQQAQVQPQQAQQVQQGLAQFRSHLLEQMQIQRVQAQAARERLGRQSPVQQMHLVQCLCPGSMINTSPMPVMQRPAPINRPSSFQQQAHSPSQPRITIADPLMPQRGQQIERPYYAHSHYDKKSVVMSLHQAHVRSPERVLSQDKETGPTTKHERHYQAVRSLAVSLTYIMHLHEASFTIPPEDFMKVRKSQRPIVGGRETLLPVHEYANGTLRYRLRCCQLKDAKITEEEWAVQEVSWPRNIFMRFNGQTLTVRRASHNGKDLPVELTDFVVSGPNHLVVVVPLAKSPGRYYFAVEVVETLSHSEILDRVWRQQVIPREDTVKKIGSRVSGQGGEDDEVLAVAGRNGNAMADLSIDVTDPFSRSIFKIPARGKACSHMECFDLETWLDTRPVKQAIKCAHLSNCSCAPSTEPSETDKWKCPVCFKDARPGSLRVDSFLLGVRQELEKQNKLDTKSILVAADGNWRPVVEADDDDSGSDGDDDVARGPAAVSRKKCKSASVERSAPPVEVIEID